MGKEPVIQIKDVSYEYEEGIKALNHVSTEIYPGEKIAVIGANGAGKSTFFLCMNGVLAPDEGIMCYKSIPVKKKDWKELRKHVGIVFQDADSQIIASTVYSEVSFGPMNLRLSVSEVKERTEQALAYMNLQEFRGRAPHYLSGGEKKRVSIADIIAMEPEVIIFDEPATGLDPYNQQVLENVLARLASDGKTILLSTHDVDFAYRFADRVMVFGDGQIIADGSTEAVFSDENLLNQANLICPYIMRVYELLKKKGIVEADSICPKNIEGLSALF